MKKNKKFLLTVLIVSLLVLTLCLLVACGSNSGSGEDEKEDTETVEATEGLLISNSDFKVSSSSNGAYSTYPSGTKGWTGASMYSSGKFPTGVIAGVISIEDSKYNDNKSKWEGIEEDLDTSSLNAKLKEKYDTSEGAINNMLMVYMPKASANKDDEKTYGPTAYGYTSSSFTLGAGKYYKFSVDVLTLGITGNTDTSVNATPGARIYLSSSDYVEYKEINTSGAWKTYTVYFKAHETTDKSMSVLLGLGKASSLDESTSITAGFVFYSNVLLEEVKDTETKTASDQFIDAQAQELISNATLQTSDLNAPNGKFDFGSETVSASSSPSLWSIVTGASDDSSIAAPTAAERYNALIDPSKFADNYEKYAGTIYVKGDSGNVATNPAKTAFENKGFENIIYNDLYASTHVGKSVYMLSQQLMTAQGIKASTSINISKNAYYAITIDVLTYYVSGAGLNIELTGGPKDLKLKNITKNVRFDGTQETGDYATNGAWTTYTIYVKGNQYEDSKYTLTLWFGTDGTDKNNAYQYEKYTSSSSSTATTYHSNGTFSSGWVFFDDFMVTRLSESDFDTAYAAYQTPDGEMDASDPTVTALAYKLDSTNLFDEDASYVAPTDKINAEFNSIDTYATTGTYADIDKDTKGTPNGFKETLDDEDQETLPVINVDNMRAGIVKTTGDDAFNFASLGLVNPGQPYDYNDNVLMIYSNELSYYQYETNDFKVLPNKFYRVSLWINTQDIQDTSGAYVYLMAKNNDDKYTSKSSFTQINTQTKDDDGNAVYNWQELTFVIRGAEKETTLCHLKITFGTGTRWTSSTLASGALFVTNVNMDSMTYKEWTGSTSGTYLKSVSFVSSSTSSFTNGTFNELNMTETEFGDSGALADSTKVGTPESWTLSDSKTEAVTGVVQLKDTEGDDLATRYTHSAQTTELFGTSSDGLFDGIYSNINTEKTAGYFGAPNLLALGSKDASEFNLGYLSNSVTLAADTYYEISVWVRALKAGTYSIYLVCDNEGIVEKYNDYVVSTYFIHTAADNEAWTEYKFYVSVGSVSISARVLLEMGIDEEKLLAANVTRDDEEKFVSVKDFDANTNTEVTYTKLASYGLFLFDNITIHSSTTEAFGPEDGEKNYRIITYSVDSFTPASTSVSALSSLTDPSYWSGVADGDADLDNTKSGIIYIAGDHLETRELADASDTGYVSILGADITVDEQTVSTEEAAITVINLITHLDHFFPNAHTTTVDSPLDDVKDEFATKFGITTTDPDARDTEIKKKNIECWKKEKAAKEQKDSWIQLTDITTVSGNSCLVINNVKDSAYYYTNSLSLSASKFYKISVWVRTLGLDSDKGAYLYLSCGEDEKADTTIANINVADWTLYTFVISVSEDGVSAPKFQLGLGKFVDEDDDENTMVKGYAFFDDFAVEEISHADYETAVASDKLIKYEIPEKPVEAKTDDEPEADTPDTSFNLDMLWWMIPTILLALATLIVLVVFFVKKIKRPKKADDYESNAIVGTRDNSQQVIDQKHDNYDNYKE